MTYLGYDLSSVQGENINFAQVKAQGIDFIVAKNYQGNDGQDPNYNYNITASKQIGLCAGTYNFIYPLPSNGVANRDPVSQAKLHFSTCLTNDGFVATDCEWPTSDAWAQWGISASFIVDWIVQYQETYRSLSGKYPTIYTYPNWMQTLVSGGADVSPLKNYSLWAASYEISPTIPAPWNTLPSPQYVMWQYNGGGGKLPSGAPVDCNSCQDLSVFGNIVPTVIPSPTITDTSTPEPVVASPPIVQPATIATGKYDNIISTALNIAQKLLSIKL